MALYFASIPVISKSKEPFLQRLQGVSLFLFFRAILRSRNICSAQHCKPSKRSKDEGKTIFLHLPSLLLFRAKVFRTVLCHTMTSMSEVCRQLVSRTRVGLEMQLAWQCVMDDVNTKHHVKDFYTQMSRRKKQQISFLFQSDNRNLADMLSELKNPMGSLLTPIITPRVTHHEGNQR